MNLHYVDKVNLFGKMVVDAKPHDSLEELAEKSMILFQRSDDHLTFYHINHECPIIGTKEEFGKPIHCNNQTLYLAPKGALLLTASEVIEIFNDENILTQLAYYSSVAIYRYKSAETIRTLRQKQNLSVEELAKKASLSIETAQNIETWSKIRPKIINLIKISDVLNIDPRKLTFYSPEDVKITL